MHHNKKRPLSYLAYFVSPTPKESSQLSSDNKYCFDPVDVQRTNLLRTNRAIVSNFWFNVKRKIVVG